MKNKSLIIVNIILLSCVVIALVVFMVFGLNGRFNFALGEYNLLKREEFKVQEVEKLVSELKSFDLTVKYGDIDTVVVEVYGSDKNKDNFLIDNKNGDLTVKQTGSSICFGFCYSNSEVIVYVPEDFKQDATLKSISGEIEVLVDLDTAQIETTSGDIRVNTLNVGKINSTSGEIKVKKGDNLSINSTSGDVEVVDSNYLEVKTLSGEVLINKLTSGGNIKTTSGDISIDRFRISEDTNISSTSGEVDIYLENDAYILTDTKSGDIDIKKSRGDYELNIKTTSGDITVK